MELFSKTREKIGLSRLRKKLSKIRRKVNYSGFGSIRKIGIVWDSSKTAEFMFISRFCQKMNERNIDVKIIGYFPGKNLPDQYTAIRYFTCFRKDEVSLIYHPTSEESISFINTRFDILIDINFKKLLPLSYISALSMAQFKIGLFEPDKEDDSIFDLMMELKAPVDVDNYLTQTVQYLEMINGGKAST